MLSNHLKSIIGSYDRDCISATEQVKVDTGIWHAISSANIIVQLSLLTLIVMSVVTWADVASKRKQFRKVREANEPFLEEFWRANSLDDIYENIKRFGESPLAKIFKDGYLELRKMADSNLATKKNGDSSAPLLTGIDNLERALRKAIDSEMAILEHRLSFLATTGSSGPFIGLFGTVIGIMTAFQKIANRLCQFSGCGARYFRHIDCHRCGFICSDTSIQYSTTFTFPTCISRSWKCKILQRIF
ncbi:MAG: MotA/TolQ/ExbB proton channel family protein [Bdellovibrionales bacterium]